MAHMKTPDLFSRSSRFAEGSLWLKLIVFASILLASAVDFQAQTTGVGITRVSLSADATVLFMEGSQFGATPAITVAEQSVQDVVVNVDGTSLTGVMPSGLTPGLYPATLDAGALPCSSDPIPCDTIAHFFITIPGDGQTGAQGPAGPTGPQGPQGELGPVGPTGPTGAGLQEQEDGSVVLSATGGVTQSQGGDGLPVNILQVNPISGRKPFQMRQFTGFNNGIYDDFGVLGWNVDPYAGGTPNGEPSFSMAFENDFFNGANHTMEWYVNYLSPDKNLYFRPFFTSVLRDDNSSYQAQNIIDMGLGANGSFDVMANGFSDRPRLHVDRTSAQFFVPLSVGSVGASTDFRIYSNAASGTGAYGFFRADNTRPGRVTYFGGNGSSATVSEFAFDSEVLPRVDNSNALGTPSSRWRSVQAGTGDSSFAGRVGIGTTSPRNKFEVNGGVLISPNSPGKDTFEFSTHAANEGRLNIKNVDEVTVQIRAGGASFFNGGNVGIGKPVPTSRLDLAAGTSAAGTAPLGFTSGPLLSQPAVGKIEFLNDAWYGTVTTGAQRKQFAFTSDITDAIAGINTGDQITSDDNAGNGVVYPTWVSATTGSLPKNVSSAKLTFVPSTGVLSAVGFAGPLVGNVTGNVSGTSGSTTGNAATATALQTARSINGVPFDGTADIIMSAISSGGSAKTGNLLLGDITSTIVDDNRYCSFPGLARLPNGVLLAVYRCGGSHVSVDGVIRSKMSADQGMTWSPESTVFDPGAGLDARDPEIKLLRNGTLLLTISTSIGAALNSSVIVMKGTINSDNAVTWSSPISVSSPFLTAGKFYGSVSKVLELADGTILLPVYGQNSGDPSDPNFANAAVVKSTDGGATWGAQVLIAATDGSTKGYSESNGVILPDGRITLIIRQDISPKGYYEAHSDDDGLTWSTPTEVISSATVGKPAVSLLASGAMLLVARTNSASRTGYAASWDTGATWTSFTTYNNLLGTDMYDSTELLSGGDVAAAISHSAADGNSAAIVYQDFYDGNGVFAGGSIKGTNLYASGSIGIGTTNPAGILDISSDDTTEVFFGQHSADGAGTSAVFRKSRGSAASPMIVSTGDEVGSLAFEAHDGASYVEVAAIEAQVDGVPTAGVMPGRLAFFTTNAAARLERMRIDKNGNVGIGTTNPGYALQVGTTGSSVALGGAPTANGSGRLKFINSNTATNWQISSNDSSAGALEFTPSTAGGGSGFATPAMLISNGRNVGIGTSTPRGTLDVNGTTVISPNNSAKDTFEFSTHAANEGRMRIKNVDTLTVQIRAGGPSYFNGGNVGIGTTAPNAKLDVAGGDIHVGTVGAGIILHSPNGSCFRVGVNDSGALSTTAVSCP
jgi:hypothetical protein